MRASWIAKWTYSSQVGLVVVLGSGISRVVDEGKSSAGAATELSLETIDWNAVFLDFEGLGELWGDFGLGDVGHLGVDEVDGLHESVVSEGTVDLQLAF